MEGENYGVRTVAIEGGDQVGKGDGILNLSEALEEEGESISMLALPFYALPIGMSIRKMLCTNQESLKQIEGLNDIVGTARQTEMAMAMFTLNRLEVLGTLEKVDGLLLLDRSAFSHAVTISYNIFLGNVPKEEMAEFAYKGLSMDELFINTLNLSNCVLNLRTEKTKWNAARGKGEDMYEREEVQEICDAVCDIFQEYAKEWMEAVLLNDKPRMYRSSIKIAEQIANGVKKMTLSSEIKESFKRILNEYPEVYNLLEAFAGVHYVSVLRKVENE